MRNLFAAVAIAAAWSGPLTAQTVTITPIAGISNPLTGEMVMWEPIPSMSGFDSVPVRHRYTTGFTVGALAEWNSTGRLGLAAQVTATFATREIDDPNTPECGDCSGVVYGLGLLATTSREIGAGTRLHLGVGPELLMFSGGAVSNEGHAPTPHAVVMNPTALVGALAAVGISRTLGSGRELRLSVAYRRYSPTHEGTRPDLSPEPNVDEDTFQDLLVTVGFRFRLP